MSYLYRNVRYVLIDWLDTVDRVGVDGEATIDVSDFVLLEHLKIEPHQTSQKTV